jgi:hypothetical protein
MQNTVDSGQFPRLRFVVPRSEKPDLGHPSSASDKLDVEWPLAFP